MVELTPRYIHDGSLYIHSNLLTGRAIKIGQHYHKRQLEQGGSDRDGTDFTIIVVGTDSIRALTLWSRWLYGLPMWTPIGMSAVDEDLMDVLDIYNWCAGLPDGKGKDYEGMNACLDAVRDILLNEAHVPRSPLSTLDDMIFKMSTTGIEMLVDLLVYGACATDGRTQEWLKGAKRSSWAEFHQVLSLGFAKKVMGGDPPDFMAPGRYHVHPPT